MSSVKSLIKRCFNYRFFLQNLKKSKGTIILLSVLIVIFNALYYISRTDRHGELVLGPDDIGLVNLAFTYIFPIVLSMLLFGFVFSKKSVDFVSSMPISRRCLFLTNTIGGGILIALVVSVSMITVKIISLFFFDTYIAGIIIAEQIFEWTIYMMFVFSVCNFAMTLVGNEITRLIVTSLILFLPSFLVGFGVRNDAFSTYSFRIDNRQYNICDDEDLLDDYSGKFVVNGETTGEYDKYEYSTASKYVWGIFGVATPATLGFATGGGPFEFFDMTQFILTVVFTVGMIAGGCLLYKRKRMEVCETSTLTVMGHNIIKGLSSVIIFCLAFEVAFQVEILLLCVFIVLMIGGYILYDLITRRSITNVFYTIITLVFTMVFVGVFYFSLDSGYISFMKGEARAAANTEESLFEYDINASDICEAGIYSAEIDAYLMSDDAGYVDKIISCLNEGPKVSADAKFKTKDGDYFIAKVYIDESRFNEVKEYATDNNLKFNLYDYLFDNNIAVEVNGIRISSADLRKMKKAVGKSATCNLIDDNYRSFSLVNYNGYTYLDSFKEIANYKYVIDINTLEKYEIKMSGNAYYYMKSGNVQCFIEYYYAMTSIDSDTLIYNSKESGTDVTCALKLMDENNGGDGFKYDYPEIYFYDYYRYNVYRKSIHPYINDALCEVALNICNGDVDEYVNNNEDYDSEQISQINVAMQGVSANREAQSSLDSFLTANFDKEVSEFLVKHAGEKVDVSKQCAKITLYTSILDDKNSAISRRAIVKKGGKFLQFYTNDIEEFTQLLNDASKKNETALKDICDAYVKAGKIQNESK